jgi:phage tail P2-like protein
MPTLLPPSSSSLEYAIEKIDAEHIDALTLPHRTLWSADDCPVDFLPWLAWALSVDVWRDTWPESVKREAIRNASDLHRKKGTAGAVKQAVNALGANIKVTEWWEMEPLGNPFTFEVVFTPSQTLPNDIDFQEDIIASIDASKNLRSSYDLIVEIPATKTLRIAGQLRTGNLVTLGNAIPTGNAIDLPLTIPVLNPNAEVNSDNWTTITGSIQRIDAPYEYFAPGVFTANENSYCSAYQDWTIPLRARREVQAGTAQIEYSYWTSDTSNAQVCLEAFDGAGNSLGVYIPDAHDVGITQVVATVVLPSQTNVVRLLQQFNAEEATELFNDLITATLSTVPEV